MNKRRLFLLVLTLVCSMSFLVVSGQSPVVEDDIIYYLFTGEEDYISGGFITHVNPEIQNPTYEEIAGVSAMKLTIKEAGDPYFTVSSLDISAYPYAVMSAYYKTDNTTVRYGSLRVNSSKGWAVYENVEYTLNGWKDIVIDLTSVANVYQSGDSIHEIRIRLLQDAQAGDQNTVGDEVYIKCIAFFKTLEEAQAFEVSSLTEPATTPVTEPPTENPETGDASVLQVMVQVILLSSFAFAVLRRKTVIKVK